MAWFTDEHLRALAGPRSYQRGTGYLDAVADLRAVPGGVRAIVHGTEPYGVRLLSEDGRLTGTCDCPVGAEGAFCKHCVALGLVVLDMPELAERDPGAAGDAAGSDLRAYLESLDRGTLVDLLHQHALDDETLARRLSLRAARRRADGQPDTAALRRNLDRALRTRGFTSYHGSFDYARRAQEILDTLEELLDGGHASLVIPLAERALALIAEASEQMDDSAGAVGDAASAALALHSRACHAAPPDDPERLARWLVDLELDGPGWPEVDLDAYWGTLGVRGQLAYRHRVERLWAELPPRRADRLPIYGPDDHRRFVVTHLMEQLAQLDQDTDRLVEIIAADLSSGWPYLRIATILLEAGRPGDALAWAERGLRETNQRPDPRLVDLAADLYRRSGRDGDALRLRRAVFERDPNQATYQALRAATLPTGQWPETRDQALAILRARAAQGGHANATLVRVLLDEQRHDDAWAAAQQAGCSDDLWLLLAEQRATTNPDDAIGVYQRLAETAIGQGTKAAYQEAAGLAERIGDLYRRADRPGAFQAWLDGLRARHRRKRNLIAELDRRGL